MTRQKRYIAGLYCRLSKDDGETVSNSIISQKEILKQYCKNEHIEVRQYYIDDGYSGTHFNRPEFKKMISDLENEKINMVVVKDLSRFGRDDAKTGMYIDHIFPELNVRFVAVNDGVDTLNDNDWMNMKF